MTPMLTSQVSWGREENERFSGGGISKLRLILFGEASPFGRADGHKQKRSLQEKPQGGLHVDLYLLSRLQMGHILHFVPLILPPLQTLVRSHL